MGVAKSLAVNLPPPSLSLSSQILLFQVPWVAAAIVDSLGKARSDVQVRVASPWDIRGFEEPSLVTNRLLGAFAFIAFAYA
jgi:hypothetical protein